VTDEGDLDIGFQSAKSATVEAMVERTAKLEREKAEKKMHPLFRRESGESSRSRSASIMEEKKPVVKAEKGQQKGWKGKVKEAVIEVDLSDDDVPVHKRAIDVEQPDEEKTNDDPAKSVTLLNGTKALGTDDDLQYDALDLLPANIYAVHGYRVRERSVIQASKSFGHPLFDSH
jgi:hypothetical protein